MGVLGPGQRPVCKGQVPADPAVPQSLTGRKAHTSTLACRDLSARQKQPGRVGATGGHRPARATQGWPWLPGLCWVQRTPRLLGFSALRWPRLTVVTDRVWLGKGPGDWLSHLGTGRRPGPSREGRGLLYSQGTAGPGSSQKSRFTQEAHAAVAGMSVTGRKARIQAPVAASRARRGT